MADTTTAQDLQKDAFEVIRRGQEAVVDAAKAWADATKQITPKLPDLSTYTGALPTPAAVVAGTYDFAEKLLANQREFAQNLLEAIEPAPAKKV